ncbi:hypothetical protein [Polaromonas sp.]|uniref:hypothetical protein n=1 Tax=Polaromonas sp. TaxID=1869339 RepID=UPI0024876AC5|nr:hypothetical protein [Polaromonas sp.]MDI1338791.1 hypothetical protein [Polaromonas sp.]
MTSTTPPLEAVYYGSPIPRGRAQLTTLGLIFDKVHFPNVSLPAEGVDFKGVEQEARRIETYGRKDYDTVLLLGLLRALPHVKDLQEFCVFTGDFESIWAKDANSDVEALVSALEEKIFGPPPAGFIPTRMPAFHKGLPGIDSEKSLTYAGALFYPANAMIYAAKHGLPLINDSDLPVPALGGQSAKNNERLLSTVLALECVALALPTVPSLGPKQIVEIRSELKGSLQPFRTGLLRLAGRLNDCITQNATIEDITEQARFLVATEIQPALLDLSEGLNRSTKSMVTRTFEVVQHLPTLAASFAAMDWSMAIAQALAAAGGILTNRQHESPEATTARSPVYYLLRLQQMSGKKR